MNIRTSLLTTVFLLTVSGTAFARPPDREGSEDYFRKWLREDVLYIITPEEAEVFRQLTSDLEKEQFIEQFWQRRDPDPRTAINEYREEHYRRIAYSNEHFTSGFPGWKTDRGMIYIKFGEPDRREVSPTGGHYVRPSHEGGGSTSTYPFERWEYRHLEGIGQDIEIEFVDPTLTGEYRLASDANEKDALLLTPNAGLTDAEMIGLVEQKIDRILGRSNAMPGHNPLLFGQGRAKDQPFEKLRLVTDLQKAPTVTFGDLRAEVDARAHFDQLSFQIQSHVFRQGSEGRCVVTVDFPPQSLRFMPGNAESRSEVDVEIVVESLAGSIVRVEEESLSAAVPQGAPHQDPAKPFTYQRDLLVPPGRYKLEVIARDRFSDAMGFQQQLLMVPELAGDDLAVSSVMMARRIETVKTPASGENRTPYRIWPAVGNRLPWEEGKIGFYFEIYGYGVDQSTGLPSLDLSYEIEAPDGRMLSGRPIHHSTDRSSQHIMILSILKLDAFTAGEYRLRIHVQDLVKESDVNEVIPFTLQ